MKGSEAVEIIRKADPLLYEEIMKVDLHERSLNSDYRDVYDYITSAFIWPDGTEQFFVNKSNEWR